MFVYDYRIRNYLHILKPGGRLNVLMALSCHANQRNRCYPSQKLLAKETGLSVATVNRAIAWLKEKGCLNVVPYHKRVDDEISLPVRQNVYQLTGVMRLDGEIIPYMYTPPRDMPDYNTVEAITESTEETTGDDEIIDSEISPSKISPTVTKVSTSISESNQKKTTTISQVNSPIPDDEKPQQGGGGETIGQNPTDSTVHPNDMIFPSEKSIFEIYEERVEEITPIARERVLDFIMDYGEATVRKALRVMITVSDIGNKVKYFAGILERLHEEQRQEQEQIKLVKEHQDKYLTNAQEKYADVHITYDHGGVA